MFTFLKHRGLALSWMKTKGNLQVPLTLAQAISVTLSLGFFKILHVFPYCELSS